MTLRERAKSTKLELCFANSLNVWPCKNRLQTYPVLLSLSYLNKKQKEKETQNLKVLFQFVGMKVMSLWEAVLSVKSMFQQL